MNSSFPLLLLALLITACGAIDNEPVPGSDASDADAVADEPVRTGAEMLLADSAAVLHDLRVGLIVNHTAQVNGSHLADRLHELPSVEVTALFGPEHGIRGTADAGEVVEDGRDPETGAPIYSLYGETRQPTSEMLENVDVLVFDIQDIGARFYTYISTMGLAMQAAAQENLPFYVLDRPNPLGGEYVSGYVLEPEQESFVGQYPIPVAHGMTVGELSHMIKDEAMLPGLESLELKVIEAEGWTRDMLWPETGLPWVAPSPNIPDFETALVYPGACFFEATSASEGRGTHSPFLLLGAPWAQGKHLANQLNDVGLPGIQFETATFTPEPIEGMASSPKLEGRELSGIRHNVTDNAAFKPVETGIHVLHAFYSQAETANVNSFLQRPTWLDRLAGTPRLRTLLLEGASPEEIIESWQDEVQAFNERREIYLLY